MPSPAPPNESPISADQIRLPDGGALASGFVWTVVGRVVGVGMLFLSTAWLARNLPTVELGAWLLANHILSVFCLLAMGGTNRTVVRFLAERFIDEDYVGGQRILRRVAGVVTVSSLLVAASLSAMLWWVGSRFLQVPMSASLIALMVAVLLLRTLQQLLAEVFRGFHDLPHASLHSGPTGSALSNSVFLAILLAAGMGGPLSLAEVFAAAAVSLLLVLPLGLQVLRRALRRTRRLAEAVAARTTMGSKAASAPLESTVGGERLVRVSLALMFIQLLGFAAQTSDVWIAGFMFEGTTTTWYMTAKQLVVLLVIPLQMVNMTVMSVIPALHRQGRTEQLSRVVRSASTISGAVGVVVLLPIALDPVFCLSAVYGPTYTAAAGPLVILTVGQMFNALTGSCGLTLMMTGYERVCLAANALAVAVMVVAGLWAAGRFGLTGLAATTSAILAIQNLVLLGLARRLVGVWTHPDLSPSRIYEMSRAVGSRVRAFV